MYLLNKIYSLRRSRLYDFIWLLIIPILVGNRICGTRNLILYIWYCSERITCEVCACSFIIAAFKDHLHKVILCTSQKINQTKISQKQSTALGTGLSTLCSFEMRKLQQFIQQKRKKSRGDMMHCSSFIAVSSMRSDDPHPYIPQRNNYMIFSLQSMRFKRSGSQ